MEALIEEFGHPTYTAFPVIAARLLLAAAFGAAIGFEREWQNRPAGLRTHILVCVAAAIFAILTVEIVHAPMFVENAAKEAVKFDPVRVVEAVTAGVAFLAAGVVIFTRGQVHGLTTGAGMWLAGAIGVASGLGLWQIALLATLIALVVLGLLYAFEKRMDLNGGPNFGLSEKERARTRRTIRSELDDPSRAEPSD
jgi:putative Mg2+ transporter-C (MgtC) family protein